MASRLFIVLCLAAVLVAATGYSEPVRPLLPITPPGIVLPDCRPQVKTLMEGQAWMKEQLEAMQKSMTAIQEHLQTCPDGWIKESGSCFYLEGEPLTVNEALESCRRASPRARLACLETKEHRELVHSMVDSSPFEQAWIGLSRVSDGWLWSDGSRLEDGGPWLPYQPDNNGGEDCVMYDRTERYPGWTQGWSDERCVLTAPSVCEISFGH